MIRPIAVYLPQFHPIPENDTWWGKGFTEWTNVRSAKPLFKGHEQPHVPLGKGYYNLNDVEVMRQQATMASSAGIEGFLFYHYWFGGKRLLEKPVLQYQQSNIDFPFMLCWANENWTRRWDGDNEEVLMQQTYSDTDDVLHMQHLLTIFSDPRYIKVAGKPVLVVYRANHLPDSVATCGRWQALAKQEGFPGLYLIRVDRVAYSNSPESQGFDAAMNFHPLWPLVEKSFYVHQPKTRWQRLKQWLGIGFPKDLLLASKSNFIADYETYVQAALREPSPPYKRYPCVMPGWDNSARRKKGNALIFSNSNPTLFKNWLQHEVSQFFLYSEEENFLFINAWNEWAEGNHLEPCERWGTKYLEAVKFVFNQIHLK